MLITPRGEPIPPQSVVKRLAAVDERLSIKWIPSAVGAYWGIIEAWAPGDPRWADVKSGVVLESAAFDLRAMLPPDCSVEEAEGFVARNFERVTDAAEQSTKKVEKVLKHNRERKQKHVDQFLQEQEDKTVRTTTHELEVQLGVATAHPMVPGGLKAEG